MPLNRWDPTNALARLEQDLGDAASHSHGASVTTAREGDDLVITVDGVSASDVDVQVSGGRLTIKGQSGGGTATSGDTAGGGHFSSSSSSASSFSKSFSLPDGVDQSDVSTEPSANGVKVRIHNAA